MHNSNQSGNNSGQYGSGDRGFRPPGIRPLYQNSPRFHQQYVPHYTGPGTPGGGNGVSPRGQSPYVSPPHQGNYDSPNSGRNSSGGSSFYSSTPDHRGRHTPRGYRGGSPRFSLRPNFITSPPYNNRDVDCNPGSSSDIRQYYHPDMLKDPWEHLKPVLANPPQN